LPAVLRLCGAQSDRNDRAKWRTLQGVLSINGAKFFNWSQGTGGGGAIDLVLHLRGGGFAQALQWLDRHFPEGLHAPEAPVPPKPSLRLPPRQRAHLQRVKDYLSGQRALPSDLIDSLIGSGDLYADARANAVVLLRAKDNRPTGAELRGCGPIPWRGMAPGSRKDHGFFRASRSALSTAPDPSPSGIILCESAIDALSCLVLHPGYRCLSTAGARPNPRWLADLLAPGLEVFCGFDADPVGDTAAQAMISLHPTIQRLRPPRKDWNDSLRFPS
jgi:hypothetical protein